jgi:hypothetical protein
VCHKVTCKIPFIHGCIAEWDGIESRVFTDAKPDDPQSLFWITTNAPLPAKGVAGQYDVTSIAIETSEAVFVAAATSIIVGEIQNKRKVQL